MALAVVQARKIEALASFATINSAWTPTGGNLIVAGLSCFDNGSGGSNTTHSASDNLNGTYTMDRGDGGVTQMQTSIHHKANCVGGLANLTAQSGNGAVDVVVGMFHEVSGADPTAPFTSGEAGGGTFAATTNPQTPAVTNSVPDSIFFAVLANADGSATSTLTVNSTGSSPTGWALKDAAHSQEVDGNNVTTASMPFKIVSTSAATKHGWTTGNFAGTYSIAAFKAASGGATPLPRKSLIVAQAVNRAATY